MGRKCNVLDCPSDSNRTEDNGVTFHKMPFHPDLRPKWIELCRIPKERQTNKVIYVCSRHFRRTDFCNFKGTKYMLRQGALPSVFPWTKSIIIPPQTSKTTLPLDEESDSIEIKTEEPEDEKSNNIDESGEVEVKVEIPDEPEEEKEKSSEKPKIKKDISPPAKKDTTTSKKEPVVIINKEINEIPIPIENNLSPVIRTEPINFLPGTRIEANDFNEKWNPATILEVDYDENEVFVEFEKHLNKANEWIPMDSSRLRPYHPPPTNIETYAVGERVLAAWIKTVNKFPATIKKVIDSETYEVLFDDGFLKVMKYSKLAKIKDVSASRGRLKHSSPLFDPVVGSKEDRRERKRKLNVAELFGKVPLGNKKYKGDEYVKSEPEDDVQSQEEFRSTGSSSQNEGEEWTCRWLNGEPVGIEAELEGLDGPRRSIIVADHRLPPGWEKHLTQRLHGNNAGKWDVFILNSSGKRFSTRGQVKAWLDDNKLDYNVERFDFCLHLNRTKKLGLYEITDPDALAAAKAAHPKEPLKFHRRSSKSHSNKISTPKSGSAVNLPVTPDINDRFPEEEEEDTSHYLKIIHEDGSYKCPIEGCGKIFRKENLAQMHVKHYHPESAKLLGSTPNVADLAYARTVGEHIDDIVPKARGVGSPHEREKNIRSESTPKPKSTLRILQPKLHSKIEEGEMRKSLTSPPIHLPKQTKDSEIIRLLNSEPKTKGIDSIFESVSSKPHEPPIKEEPIEKYPDIKLKDLLHKAEPIPLFKKEEHRSTGIKTLLPVIRHNFDEMKQEMEEPEPGFHALPKAVERLKPRKRQSSDNSEAKKRRSFRYEDELSDFYEGDSHSQDSFREKKVFDMQPVPVAPPVAESPQVIIEGGEVIRLVHMKSEEIINCTCGITEEDGLMIQCELCLCWQHAHCNNIQKENEVPEKYICYICKNPPRMRVSKKYIHDQEWLKQGVLPTANYHSKDEEALKEKFEKLRKSHELSGCMVELNEYIHNLRIKLNIADNKDHPKLYLWSKAWNKPVPNENLNAMLNSKTDHKLDIKEENLNSSFSGSDHSYIKSSTFGDVALKSMLEPPVEEINHEEKHIIDNQKIQSESELISILEEGTNIKNDIKPESTEFPKIDLNTMIANNLGDKPESKDENLPEVNKDNALSGILSTGSLELALSQTDLVTSFAQLNEVEATTTVPPVHIPQPEAVIDPSDCRMNLIEHVSHFQSLVDERLNCIEAEISELEDQDSDDDEDAYPKMKQSLQMLIKDLAAMRQIAALSN